MRWPGRMTGEVLRHVAQRPATMNYPAQAAVMPPAYRGKIVFHAAKCVGCKLCQKDCPAGALEINKVGDKRFEAIFRFDRCIYCAQCVDSCNKDAMESTREFELATLDRGTLRVHYHAPPPPPPVVVPTPAPEAASEAAPEAAPKAANAPTVP
jgi:formate hydrogenlyase subunit 6/NADH:ubiquinone oxidoreductase subunit I